MGALDVATRSAGSGAGQGQAGPITVNSTVTADFTGARFDSDIDIEKMLDQMSKKMEKVAKDSVGRAIGQGRT